MTKLPFRNNQMKFTFQKIKNVGKYFIFGLLYIFGILNLYFFWLRAWRVKDVMNYTDANYKGYLDIIEMYVGYISGWSILFIISFVYSLIYIKNKSLYAFMWLLLPVIYLLTLAYHEFL